MKYLFLFESFGAAIYDEDETRIIDSIEGIFIELQDKGFIIDTSLGFEKLLIIIHNGEPQWNSEETLFTYSQIESEILVLIDYIKKKWGNLDINYIYRELVIVNMKNPLNRFPIDADGMGPFFTGKKSKTPPGLNSKINSFTIKLQKHKPKSFIKKLLGR
jgi:hypothetical protein